MTSNDQPRQYTVEEQQKMFLDHLRGLIRYWENEARTPSVHGKLEGLVFSILVMFDGCSGGMPGFDLVSRTDPGDPEYLRSEGSNWWPTHEHLDEVDGYEPLNGAEQLHDKFCAKEREARKNGTYREPPPDQEMVSAIAAMAKTAAQESAVQREKHAAIVAAVEKLEAPYVKGHKLTTGDQLMARVDAAIIALHRLKETW